MCWKPEYVILIFFSTVIDYFSAIKISKAKSAKAKRPFLYLSLFTNLGLLFSFKYFNFFGENINVVLNKLNVLSEIPFFDVLLPVGISFYTFQTMSYTIDVYKGQIEPERHFGKFALFVTFFPQLVAGPIERASRLLPQFHKNIDFQYENISAGVKQITWGFFKKVVIADNCAMLVNQVFNNPDQHSGIFVLIAIILFTFQLYADFSGYSDIAIGSAKVLGFDLMKNFNAPYLSKNMTEFWRRWHISLSTWIRDYVFTPLSLGMRNLGSYSYVFVALISFTVFGFWHGANWTFILWGFLQGVAIAYETFTRKRRKRFAKKVNPMVYGMVSIALTYVFWTFTCIIFRANAIGDVSTIISNLFTNLSLGSAIDFFENSSFLRNRRILIASIAILFMLAVEWIHEKYNLVDVFNKQHFVIRFSTYFLGVIVILVFGNFTTQSFIYFQF